MITTIIIGFVCTSIYQLIFMAGYGTVITTDNTEMMLSRGIGIRNMIDLEMLRNILDSIWVVKAGNIEFPLFMIGIVCFFALAVLYISKSRLGFQFRAIAESPVKAGMNGINVDRVRIKAIVISTVLACFGHILYIQNIGMLRPYSLHPEYRHA